MDKCVQVIDGAGAFQSLDELVSKTRLAELSPSGYQVVAIMGPQSSGKSTLMNHVFGTSFVMMDAESGRSQTTKGVWLAVSPKISEPTTLVMDLEGSDGRERGEDDTNFERQSALFALAVADCLLINIWCHDIGREQGSGKPLLKTIFQVNLKLFAPEPNRKRTVLLFVLRDKTRTPLSKLTEQMETDLKNMWDSISKPVNYEGSSISDFFELQFVALSHFEEKYEDFVADTVMLRRRFQPHDEQSLIRSDADKLPGAAFSLSAKDIWETIHRDEDLNLPAHKVMVASVRCNEIKEKQLSSLLQSPEWTKLADEASSDQLSADFGVIASRLIQGYIDGYEAEAMYFDPTIRAQKHAELTATIDAELMPLIENQCMLLSKEAEGEMSEALSSLVSKPFPFAFSKSSSDTKSSLAKKYKLKLESLSVIGFPWTSSEVMSSMAMQMDGVIAGYRSKCFKSAMDQVEKQLMGLCLSSPVKSLLESCSDGMWSKLYSSCQSASKEMGEALMASLEGFDINDGEKLSLLADVKSQVDAKMVFHVRSASESLVTRLNQGFSDHFTLDENMLPRSWSRQDIPQLASSARARAASIMSQLSLIRRQKPSKALEEAYVLVNASISQLAKVDASQPLYQGTTYFDLSSMIHWPESISEDDILLQPHDVQSTWRQFVNSSNLLVQQATATQEAYKANNRGPPLWAIAAMVILGWNEAWALIYSPIYLVLSLVLFLFLRTLYFELDVEHEFQSGALPAFLSLAPKIVPTSKSIIERSIVAVKGFYLHLPEHVKSVQHAMSSNDEAKEVKLTPLETKKDQ